MAKRIDVMVRDVPAHFNPVAYCHVPAMVEVETDDGYRVLGMDRTDGLAIMARMLRVPVTSLHVMGSWK